jgi:hypothetical protein
MKAQRQNNCAFSRPFKCRQELLARDLAASAINTL